MTEELKFKPGDWVEILYEYDKDFPKEPVKYFAKIKACFGFNSAFPYALEGVSFHFKEEELKLVE